MNVVTTLPWGRPLAEADVATHPFGDAIVTVVDGSLVVTTAGGSPTRTSGRSPMTDTVTSSSTERSS